MQICLIRRNRCLGVIALSFLALSSLQAQEKVYKSQMTGFSVTFPGRPEVLTNSTAVGEIEKAEYEDEMGNVYTLWVLQPEGNNAISKANAGRVLEDRLWAFVERHGGETQGRKTGLKSWKVKQYLGVRKEFQGTEGPIHYCITIVDNMIFELYVRGKEGFDKKAAKAFCKSVTD